MTQSELNSACSEPGAALGNLQNLLMGSLCEHWAVTALHLQLRKEKSRWIVHLCKGQVRPLWIWREASPERYDVLQLCIILCRSICRRQLPSHGYLSAVRARRQVWSVELTMCHECHVALVDITQWRGCERCKCSVKNRCFDRNRQASAPLINMVQRQHRIICTFGHQLEFEIAAL